LPGILCRVFTVVTIEVNVDMSYCNKAYDVVTRAWGPVAGS